MKVKQVAELLNSTSGEMTGISTIIQDDLTGVVDLGKILFDNEWVDNYVGKLIDKVGRLVITDRLYEVGTPSVLRDDWEFGSVVEKVSYKPFEVTDNTSWQLVDGATYPQDIYKAPKVKVKYFNSKTTFEILFSVTDLQLKEAFINSEGMMRFVNGIFVQVRNDITASLDALIMRTLNTAIAETLYSDYANTNYNMSSHVKSVNLLYLYNQAKGTILTADKCLSDKEFLRYASKIIKSYPKKLQRRSTLFNVNGEVKFTPLSLLNIVMLDDFKTSTEVYLYSDLFNKEDATLPQAESVAFWQGCGEDFSFNSISKIDVKTPSGNEVSLSGVLAVMYDRYSLGVNQRNSRVKTHRVDLSEFVNYSYKEDESYFYDADEQVVVFFVA